MAKNIFDKSGSLYTHETLRDKFFVDTVHDLFDKVNNPTDYNIIRASGLVRQLIKEGGGQCLTHKVTRILKHKLQFRVNNQFLLSSDFELSESVRKIYNPLSNNKATETLNLGRFLNVTCMILKDKSNEIDLQIRVKDVIDILAHSHGGIHHENPDSNSFLRQTDIKDIQKFKYAFGSIGIYEGNFDSEIYRVALNIYKVILNSLRPIVIKISLKIRTTRPIGHSSSQTFKVVKQDSDVNDTTNN